MLRSLKRIFVSFLLASFTFVSFTQSVQAAIISTEQVAAADVSQQNREKVAAAISRPEVIAQLEQLGVGKLEAQARVAALTDAETAYMASEIDKLPAGASNWSWAGWLVGIFLILIVTDLLGWTHIFPWTQSQSQSRR
jgi:hypothetical protein